MNPATLPCRACGHSRLEPFLSLGTNPPSDAILTEEDLSRPEPKYPLDIAFCPNCSLVQILETVPPEELFDKDYLYFSSYSDFLLKHSRENAEDLIKTRGLNAGSLVVEIASNDGYMLKNFHQRGIPVLGIDPAENQARAAEAAGIPTLCEFFGEDLALRLRDEGKRADVIIANNVLAHVPEINGFVRGIGLLLKHDGVAVIECPYLRELIEHCEFDTMYHEHVFYYSVSALTNLFKQHGLVLFKVKPIAIHGGSLRLYVGRGVEVEESVLRHLEEEKSLGMDRLSYYRDFASRVKRISDTLVQLLRELKAQGKRIAAYGAAAKGSTLINYAGIGTDLIDFVVDRNPHKHGRYMPGQHIPIAPVSKIYEDRPDYLLLLAWNFKDEIMQQQEEYKKRGGAFIIPIPEPTIV